VPGRERHQRPGLSRGAAWRLAWHDLGHVPGEGVRIDRHWLRHARLAALVRGGDPLVANKRARNAPTPEMLDAYYTLMLILTVI
jgi:hypothetical protein